jgi:serine/threonine protein kinase/Tol biopolymer transport system component
MSLAPGQRLGPYEITAKLGEGGMGQVFQAKDFHLGRDVALKVLPEGFTQDAERLARFEREAKLLAQLNHPNIAQIYGFEASGESRALVMELVEGPTLAERLELGPLPFDECLSVSLQIAQALEEAHEKGIVHRDLKPQNIKASIEGKVKVLDFGLAKAMEVAPAAAPSAALLAQSPTLTFGATQMGMILGTAGYMSPEQAAGKLVDRRTDIWAFGVVLWEMLSGRRLFDAESVPETLGAVFRQPIDFDALPETTPPAVRGLVERCLERDPKARLRDIGEARIALQAELESALAEARSSGSRSSSSARAGAGREVASAPRSPIPAWLPWALAALSALVPTWLVLRPRAERAELPPLVAIGVSPPAAHVLAAGEAPVLDLARDGRAVAFEAEGPNGRQLFLRRLDRAEVVPIPGTQGATMPFFSPDGRSLAFYANGRIQRAPLAGSGPVADVVGVNAYRGATWAEGGWIVFTQTYSSGLSKVRESGGGPEPLTTLDAGQNERTHRWPAAIPGSSWVLFSIGVSNSPNFYDDARIGAVNLETGERKTVYEGAWFARFAPPSALLVQRRASLLALPFDPASAEVRGEGRVLLDNAGGEGSSGAGYFAAGAGGALAYVPAEALSEETAVVVVAPDGSVERLPLPERRYWYPRFSPDGRSLALDIGSGQGGDDEIWIYDFATKGMSRLTFAGGSALPVWSPDGRSLAYTGGSGARVNTTFRKRIDGSEDEVPVWKATDITSATDWTRDGRALIATDLRGAVGIGLFLVPLDGTPEVQLGAAPGGQYSGNVDPSGRYLAYTSVETGVDEIFVSTFPESRGKWQVSTDGGQMPVWSRDGSRILYVRGDAIFAVDVGTAGAFRAGTPRELRRGPYLLRTAPWRNFDVGPGDRLVFVSRRTDVQAPRQLEVLIGWQRLLSTPSRP